MSYCDLYDELGYAFAREALVEEALTHRSWLNEEQQVGRALAQRDQQRLEFLGDAFLGYVVGRFLHEAHPEASEGVLTQRRASLVKGAHVHEVGDRLGLRRYLRLGEGERHTQLNKKVVEDTVEALIGAVLLDGGDEAAWGVVQRLFLRDYDASDPLVDASTEDPISALNELWQKLFGAAPPAPEYGRVGLDHDSTWTCRMSVDEVEFTAEGATKKEARREVSRQMLRALRDR